MKLLIMADALRVRCYTAAGRQTTRSAWQRASWPAGERRARQRVRQPGGWWHASDAWGWAEL